MCHDDIKALANHVQACIIYALGLSDIFIASYVGEIKTLGGIYIYSISTDPAVNILICNLK